MKFYSNGGYKPDITFYYLDLDKISKFSRVICCLK